MKPVLKNSQDRNLINMPKVGQTSKQNSLFSYAVKRDADLVVLSQLETGYALSMKMENLEDILRLTKFTLTPSMQLTYLSPELSDAALLEMIVQALVILYVYAERYEAEEILFLLSQEDAGHLAVFEGLFGKNESLTTREGSKTSFILYNTRENREILRERIEGIKTQLKQGLWQMQRGDHYIKNFLQNHQRGTLLPNITLQDEKVSEYLGLIIPFPLSKRK